MKRPLDISADAHQDVIIAGCICLAVACYWAWDRLPATLTPAPSQPAVVTEWQRVLGDRLNDEGNRLYSASDYTGAEVRFRGAIAVNPAGSLGYCNLGAALIGEHRFDEAIVSLRKALLLDPALALAHNNLNWALQEKAKHAQ